MLVSSTMLYNTYTHILLYGNVSVQFNALNTYNHSLLYDDVSVQYNAL